MLRHTSVAISSLCFAFIVMSTSVLAQPGGVAPLMRSSSRAVNEIVQSYSISSSQDPSIIPASAYYRFIFTNLQQQIPDYLTAEDWKVISELPSHLDRRFMEDNFRDIESACKVLNETTPLDRVITIARMVDDAEANLTKRLETHYRDVLAKLSPGTQTIIEKERVRLSGTRTVGYATYDMTGLAAELPEVAREMMLRGCKAINTNKEKLARFKDEKLIDVEPRVFK